MSPVPVHDQLRETVDEMFKTVVAIPFMGTDPVRVQNLQAVQAYYRKHFDIVTASGSSIGQARNNAAFKAIAAGAENIFFLDADVLVPIQNVIQAIKVAQVTASGVYPYGQMVRTGRGERDRFIERGSLPSRSDGLPEGGALVLSRQGFIDCCGFPEISFGEDNILHNAMRCFLGPISRIWEPGYHLWHPDGSSDGYMDTRILQVVRQSELNLSDPEGMKNLFKKAGYHDISRFTAAGYRPEGPGNRV